MHFVALVYRDLGIVRFDLAEIWFESDIERQRIVQDHLGVKASAHIRVGSKGRVAPCSPRIIQKMRVPQRSIRNELKITPGRDGFEAGHVGQLRIEAVQALRDVRPEGAFIIGRNETAQTEAP